jgi:hypothetical protein
MRATVTAVFLDASQQAATGELAPLADRVEFEKRFGMSAAVLSRLEGMFDDEGNLTPDADPAALREEWIAFLVWAELRRELGAEEVADFDAWLLTISNITVNTNAEEEGGGVQVPTVTTAAPATP